MKIVGDHIILRTVIQSDLDNLYKWENDPSVTRFSINKEVITKEDLETFINGEHDIYMDNQLRLMVTFASNEEVIGTLDLFEYDQEKSSVGVGIMIFELACRGLGYGSLAMDLLMRFMVTHLNIAKVYCNIQPFNSRSIKFFKNLGFIKLPEKSTSDLLSRKLDGMDLYYFDCL